MEAVVTEAAMLKEVDSADVSKDDMAASDEKEAEFVIIGLAASALKQETLQSMAMTPLLIGMLVLSKFKCLFKGRSIFTSRLHGI
jgi:hypothetical protein